MNNENRIIRLHDKETTDQDDIEQLKRQITRTLYQLNRTIFLMQLRLKLTLKSNKN